MATTALSTTAPITEQTSIQRKVVTVLSAAQMTGGVGVGAGAAVGALLAADLATESLSGLSSTASVVGAALIAWPVSRVMNVRGRRPGLLLAYFIGMFGAAVVVLGTKLGLFPIALIGLMLTGGGQTANLQSRYAAVDLATPSHRGRALATVVWATTIGSVLGPNLASPMGRFAESIGIPKLAGPYILTMFALGVAALVVGLFLRPDPLLTARALQAESVGKESIEIVKKTFKEAVHYIFAIPGARLGLISMAIGQAVMVSVMSMTPVHLKHENADLDLIGLIISGHIAGMYVASPLVGILSDRKGRRPVIMLGCLILLVSFVLAGTAPADRPEQLAAGLFCLGLGWSCTMIAGSTLLSESIPLNDRPSIQGTADMLMGFFGASAGLLAGLVVGLGSYALLCALATLLVMPLVYLVLPRRSPMPAISG